MENIINNKRYYHSINMLRGAMALMILFHHLGGTMSMDKYFNIKIFGQLFAVGNARVSFFFVLSGLVIYLSHCHEFGSPNRAKIFLFKRFIRIYPPFWCVYVFFAVITLFFSGNSQTVPSDFLDLVRGFFLIPADKVISGGTGAPIIIAAWTLHYEVLFYALFACAMFKREIALFILFLFVTFSGIPGMNNSFPLSFFLDERIWLFICGMALANVWTKGFRVRNAAITSGLTFVSLILLSYSSYQAGNEQIHTLLTASIGTISAVFIASLMTQEENNKFIWMSDSKLQFLGNISYSLFILHFPIISAANKIAVKIGVNNGSFSVVFFIATVMTCVIFAYFFNSYIEKPLARFLYRKFSNRVGV